MRGAYRAVALLVAGGLVGAAVAVWVNPAPPPVTVLVAQPAPVPPPPTDLIPRASVPAFSATVPPPVRVDVPSAPPPLPPVDLFPAPATPQRPASIDVLPIPSPAVPDVFAPAAPAAPPVVKPATTPKPPPAPPGRTAIRFGEPAGVRVSWQADGGAFHDRDLTAPAVFNFTQGRTYRLRLAAAPHQPARVFYPSLDVAAPTPGTETFLTHCAVPLAFSEAELALAAEGQLVVKAVYLPRASYGRTGEVVTAGVEEVSSVRVGPRADVVARAKELGDVLAVVRLGNVDLENPHSPPLSAPPGGADVPPAEPAPRPRVVPAAE